MMARAIAGSVDDYIAGFDAGTQAVLRRMRELIRDEAPGASETISYSMPTFDLNGRHLVHFAAHAHHIGFYPVPSAMQAFSEELAPYRGGKGSARFPLGQPLPEDLIRRIVAFRVRENLARPKRS